MTFGKAITAGSWLLVVVAWVILQSSVSQAAVKTIPLDLTSTNKDDYSTFLTSIRDYVKDPKLAYGGTNIPVAGKPSGTFFRIDLKYSGGTVSLGLLKDDLYVMGYLAKNDKGKFVAYYFKDKIKTAQLNTLFPEAKGVANQKAITEYNENYKKLEDAAKQSRKEAGLGIKKLVKYIEEVNGKVRKVTNEARFIMVAIQMVSEAARFGYIENLVRDNYPNIFTPDDEVIIYERNWKRISTAIKASIRGVFKQPLVLEADPIQTVITAKNAAELKMKLLKYLGNNLVYGSQAAEIFKGYLGYEYY